MTKRSDPDNVPTIEVGGLRVRGPERAGRYWLVTAVDSVLEEVAEKKFDTAGKAQDFIDELVKGHGPVNPLDEAVDERQPRQGRAARKPEAAPAPPQLTKSHTRHVDPANTAGPKDPEKAPFNLGAVRDVLERYQLDPFVEIAVVLQKTKTVNTRDDEGKVTGKEETLFIDGLDRATIMVELAQYTTPKLKAVEMKIEDKTKLTSEQLDERIDRLLGKAPHGAPGQ